MMLLSMAQVGEENSIKRVIGKEDVCRHLENLGFVPGESVTVISHTGGNLIVSIKDSRIAIDKTLANKIMI